MTRKVEQTVHEFLSQAGITINGSKPWDIQVNSVNFYRRLARGGDVGAGESYMVGEWDCPAIDETMARIFRAGLTKKIKPNRLALGWLFALTLAVYSRQSRVDVVAKVHYDLGNDLFSAMLDKRMVYTSGYWPQAKNLDEAQIAKLDLVCRKIGLKPGMTLLDIGGGWGSLAKFAAERYGAVVTNITVSREQATLAEKLCLGLPVKNLVCDYRDVTGTFDRVVSLGMFEHVNAPNYHLFMRIVGERLADDGLFLLHTIGANQPARRSGWLIKYIFPNSSLPTATQIMAAAEGRFVMEDWHNFGADYDKTLMAWYSNSVAHWPGLQAAYGERFFRMWTLYLLGCAGAFRARYLQLWQIVFSKSGVVGGYIPTR